MGVHLAWVLKVRRNLSWLQRRGLDWRRQERSWAEIQESIRKTISDCRIEVFTQQTN